MTKSDDDNRGGKRLYKERTARNWSQGRTSRETKIPQPRLSRYERGLSTPGLKHAVSLQKKLGIPVEIWL